jgi:hypothetical protein
MAEKTRRSRMQAEDPARAERLRARSEEIRSAGFDDVTPLVVHGDEVIGWNDDFEAARIVGLEDMVPRITLQQVFEEAGMDMSQIASPDGEEEGASEREFYEDYLRSLPEHIRDKYGI